MAEEDEYAGDFTPPTVEDNSSSYFIQGEGFSDPPPPEGNPAPLPLEPNEWAVEFYELEVE